ncbi:LOW QUALITY PROTEIN: hypothetical protein CRUP_019852, partial [Coryphaenoides rupestris]
MFNRLATVAPGPVRGGGSRLETRMGDGLVPQQPASEAPGGWEGGGSEEATERLAHLEQLVVQLKELVRDKDAQLAHKDTLLQNEKETAEARFTKLKLQAKAKMVSLNKQIHELKGQEGPASPNSSFTGGPGPEVLEEELRALKTRLAEEEAGSRDLLQRLQTTQHLLQEKEVDHAEQMSAESVQHATQPSELDSSESEKAQILSLEQQLLEKDSELAALRESLALAREQTFSVAAAQSCDQNKEQDGDATVTPGDSVAADSQLLEESPEEDTTLVAEDTSILSSPTDNGSSPELIQPQSDSPGESKGASSDEMVTSTDSEVAHSSWTLLDAVNQDGCQEWPSVLQDFGQLQMQSWEETSVEQETTTVRAESSSVIIHETVQVQLSQQGESPTHPTLSSGQVFAQAEEQSRAEELQRRYSELLAELQSLRETSAVSQERILSLEEERNLLVSAKEEAESRVRNFDEELQSAREEIDKLTQQGTLEKNNVELSLLEEQITILKAESETKEHTILDLQSELERTQQALSEQEIQASMRCTQLEDQELLSSELECKLQNMESSLLEYSQCTDVNNASLVEKDSEINELRLRLTEKEQEMMELCDGMSAKLLQAGEEKFAISSEVKQLKEQISELDKVREQEKQINTEGSVAEDELGILRKDKEALENQLGNMKKKLQVALVQRKELMKKVADFEGDAKKQKQVKMEQDKTATVELLKSSPMADQDRSQEIQELEAMLNKAQQSLKSKEQEVEALEQKMNQQDQILSETLALNARLCEEAQEPAQAHNPPEAQDLQSQLASLHSECEMLHKKLLDAQESRKETIRKAKEKDRHHREQLKQLKEEYNDLMGRFEGQSAEHQDSLTKLIDLEKLVAQHNVVSEKEAVSYQAPPTVEEPQEKSETAEIEISEEMEKLREECQASQMARTELAEKLQVTKTALSQKEIELEDLGKKLEGFREREKQADVLSEEIQILREKFTQAESYAETIKLQMEATAKAAVESSVTNLQAEVEEFKLFLDNKNQEIQELSQQLGEQNSLLRSIQTTVSQKDQLILSLQEDLKAEQEKTLRLENEIPLKQEEDRDSEAKVQQLQRKLQAALISRKDVLKENKTQKEELAANEIVIAELKGNTVAKEAELEKLRTERVKLIEEVDRTLVENQSLGSSCESLKLAMEGILSEKDSCQREVKFAKEEAARTCRDLQEKIQSMKEEYETLLKSYENVSDEAERVRRVLEAARQERQELAAKIRTHEVAKQDAEKQVEDARKEVDLVKDKMRKYAKTKQQKILDLEEENERLQDIKERKGGKKDEDAVKVELERLREEQKALKIKFDVTAEERDSLVRQVADLTEQLAQQGEKIQSPTVSSLNSGDLVEESIVAQQSATLMAQTKQQLEEFREKDQSLTASLQQSLQEIQEKNKSIVEESFNGSIAGYQQEVGDTRERLAELQREVERLERERAELEAQAQSEMDRAARLEEDKRQAQRERAEAEAEVGKQRELEQQLRSAQRVREGSQNRTRQLEELLREKQLEMRQLQNDSIKLGAELKEIELRLEEAYRERDKEEEATLEAREVAAGAKRQAQEMQARLDESLARLAAFSRCMSSLQDDRDRVLDEVRQWETRFSNTLQGKESEVRQGETRAKDLSEQLQKEISLKEALQASVERLEKTNIEQQSRLEEEDKKAQEVQATLELEQGKLKEATAQLQHAQAEVRALASEAEGLGHGKQALEEAVERLQGEVERARAELVEREVDERRLCLHVEQLETDLRASKVLLESLQTELSEKERREVELLGEKEQAVTQAAEEARLDADGRAQQAEAVAEQRRAEARRVAEEVTGGEQPQQGPAGLLHEGHGVMMEKDGLIQEAAGENNGLKEELRSLLAQRDDLYAERAKLASQLHNYREELNQVLTLKESQHKQVLAAQRERIASLEHQRQELEAQVRSLGEGPGTKEAAVERETLSQGNDPEGTVRDAPGAEVEKLREQLQTAREQAEALEESLRAETQSKEARDKELAELRWGDGVMRTESENAQERVAELARDLLMVEQRLLEEKEASDRLRAENKSFGKAMASLQDSREQSESKAHELGLRLEEMRRAGEGQTTASSPGGGSAGGASSGERQKADLVRLGAGELVKVSQELGEERGRAERLLGLVKQLEETSVAGKQEVEMLRLERVDWLSEAERRERREQQTLAAVSQRDQQISQLGALLEEARVASKPRQEVLREGYQREVKRGGASLRRMVRAVLCSRQRTPLLLSIYLLAVHALLLLCLGGLDEESEQRAAVEEQLLVARDQLQRHTQGEWVSARDAHSDTAVLIEPPGGAIRQ